MELYDNETQVMEQGSYMIQPLSPSKSLVSLNQSVHLKSISPTPKPLPMHFGASKRSHQERVLDSMLKNQQRDPEVNLKSILGNDELVMNLRPTDKSKWVGPRGHMTHKAATYM